MAGSIVDIAAFLSSTKSLHTVFGGDLLVKRILQFLPRGVEPDLPRKRRQCNALVFLPMQRLAVNVELSPVHEIDLCVPRFEAMGPPVQVPPLV